MKKENLDNQKWKSRSGNFEKGGTLSEKTKTRLIKEYKKDKKRTK